MRLTTIGLGLACLVIAALGTAQEPTRSGGDRPADTTKTAMTETSHLQGTWKVDLRPTPDAEPYFQEFVVDSVKGKSFFGTFYGTAIEGGRLNSDWGALCFAFVTRDGSGPYNHSGVFRDGRLEGLSHSPGREFLAVWTAEPTD